MKSTPEAFRSAVAEAYAGSRRLEIERYSSANGKISNFVVELLPADGYDDLVKRSHEDLTVKREELKQNILVESNGEVTPEMVDCCIAELLASWERRMAGQISERVSNQDLTDSGQGYHTKAGSDTVTVFNVLRISEDMVTPPRKKESKWGKTRVKSALTRQLPIGDYIGQMNFKMDNVDDVRVVV